MNISTFRISTKNGTATFEIFQDLHVLDAGCGTGHHAKLLVEMGVGKLTLVDASPEMLSIAKLQLKDAIKQNVVNAVIEAKLPDLPFEDGIFDAVMFNNVSSLFLFLECTSNNMQLRL